MNFEKLFNYGVDNAKYFKKLADQFVDEYMEVDSDEARTLTSAMTATQMAMGAKARMDEHLIAGIIIGSAVTLSTTAAVQIITKKRREKKLNKEINDTVEL